jgi:hypothetical protein
MLIIIPARGRRNLLFFEKNLIKSAVMSAMNGYAIKNPPVGPANTATPLLNPAKTGIPTIPIRRYTISAINALTGGRKDPVKKTARSPRVNGTGENGSGTEIRDKTH